MDKFLELDKMSKLALEEIEDVNKHVAKKLRCNQRPPPKTHAWVAL